MGRNGCDRMKTYVLMKIWNKKHRQKGVNEEIIRFRRNKAIGFKGK
jgi:hypothetical protein